MSFHPQRVVGVEHRVAGFAEVAEEELKRKLGRAAWHVWQVLCVHRDRRGVVRVSTRAIAEARGFMPTNRHVVKDGLRRLTDAHLVQRIGWSGRKLLPTGLPIPVKFERRCMGARQLSVAGAERCAVPIETKEWLVSAKTYGGPRPGTGRPKSSTPNPPNQVPPTLNQVPPTPPPKRANQVPPTTTLYVSMSDTVVGQGGSLPSEGNNAPAGAQVLILGDAEIEGGARRAAPMLSLPLAGLPLYPGNSVVAAAAVPDPPKLMPDDTEERAVRLLAWGFRGAVEREYGASTFLLAKLSPKSKSYVLLAQAAQLLRQYDIAPAAWCAYAVRRWYLARTHSPGYVKGAPVALPPVGVIFSPAQIDKRLSDEDHRDTVESLIRGGRLVFGKTHKALLVRYQAMRSAVIGGQPRAEALALFFPGSSYDELVEAARVEAKEIRHRLEADVARGKMVWT